MIRSQLFHAKSNTKSQYNVGIELQYLAVISFVAGIAWTYSVRVPINSIANNVLYAFILFLIAHRQSYQCLLLFLLGALLAKLNPINDTAVDNYDERFKLLRIERVLRTQPYFSAEVVSILPKERCHYRVSADPTIAHNLSRGHKFWASLTTRPIIASRNRAIKHDYERWQANRGICASAKITRLWPIKGGTPLIKLRQRVRHIIAHSGSSHRDILQTLLLGEHQNIAANDRRLLSNLGVGHLLAISGLHITLIASYGFLLALPILWVTNINALYYRAFFALLIATIYALTSGFDPPALRALGTLMLVIVGRQFIITQSLAAIFNLLVFTLAVINPPMVAHPSAQASFMAICVILVLLTSQWVRYPNPRYVKNHVVESVLARLFVVKKLIYFQVALSLAMAWFFYLNGSALQVLSPIANILIVPLFSLALPIAFIWIITALLGFELAYLINIFDGLFGLIFSIAQRLNAIALSHLYRADAMAWVITLVALLALYRRQMSFIKPMGFLALISVMVVPRTIFKPDAARLNIVDIGQGSAALLQTSNYQLLIDTGARYATGFDAGLHIINPILNATRRPLNTIVLSHSDRDHIGGYPAIIDEWGPIKTIGDEYEPCRGNISRPRLNISLYRFPDALNENDRSCVVLIKSHGYRILIPGDIEEHAEEWLIERLARDDNVPIDVLVVPHHGSLTSSTERFVQNLAPQIAIVSRGLYNNYGHPKMDVIKRFQQIDTRWLDTACDGGVVLTIEANGITLETSRRWRDSKYLNSFYAQRCQ